MAHLPSGSPSVPRRLLYLGSEDVTACALTPVDITDAVARAFAAKARGEARTNTKLSMPAAHGVNFSAKGGVLDDAGFAAVKWYGYAPGNVRHGLPDFSPLVILSSSTNGMPLAVIDGNWLSAVRTAAISGVAARILARADSANIGFVACGAQAHSHLQTFAQLFPLKRAVAYSRSEASARRLADAAVALGLESQVVTDPHDAVQGMDIVITSVPHQSEPRCFLDATRVSPGCFVSMVCLGYSWSRQTLGVFDWLVTDDHDPHTRRSAEALNFDGEFSADLEGLLSRAEQWRPSPRTRSALIFAGSGLADAAAAGVIYQRALERSLGRWLDA